MRKLEQVGEALLLGAVMALRDAGAARDVTAEVERLDGMIADATDESTLRALKVLRRTMVAMGERIAE